MLKIKLLNMQTVKIKSITKIPKTHRHHLTVPSTSNFFANNILIHNTSLWLVMY